MKSPRLLFALLLWLLCHVAAAADSPNALVGAWQIKGDVERALIITEDYWTQAQFSREKRQFFGTFGGTYVLKEGVASGIMQFNSSDPSQVGSSFQVRLRTEAGKLILVQDDGTEETWTRVDSAEGPLAGAWRIGSRNVKGEMREMPLAARRTLKILSGTRFQWIAMNVETGEFSGTGGGTYMYRNGKYVETLEFFSRDDSRVGARLEFDAEVTNGTWQHKGLSSRGDPINELWVKFQAGKM